VLDELEESPPHAPVVGDEIGDVERLAVVGPEHDVHSPRQPPLYAPELLGVERELEQEVRLRVPRQLRVRHLVGSVRLPLDEVRDAAPAIRVDQHALVDDVVAATPDRARGLRGRPLPVAVVGVDLEDRPTFSPKPLEVRALVLLALTPDELRLRIVADRALEVPTCHREPERSQVLAFEEVVQM
jgi:hypothetical protein